MRRLPAPPPLNTPKPEKSLVGFVRPDRQGWISLPIAVFAKVGSDRVVDLTHVLFAHAVAVHDKPG